MLDGDVASFLGKDPHLSVNDFAETKVGVPSLHCLVEDDEMICSTVLVSNEDTHRETKSATIPNITTIFPFPRQIILSSS